MQRLIKKPPKKQRSRGVLRKSCFENMQQIYRRTPMPNCNFNKVAPSDPIPTYGTVKARKPEKNCTI